MGKGKIKYMCQKRKFFLRFHFEEPIMTEEVILKVPPGTQSHTIFRIKGKGMPRIRGRGHGDLMIRLVVEIPVKLSKKKKTDLKTLFPNTPHSTTIRGFFDRLTEQKAYVAFHTLFIGS